MMGKTVPSFRMTLEGEIGNWSAYRRALKRGAWFMMGKTVPSFRMTLEGEIGNWSAYRRALKRGERRIFDELMGYTRTHTSASGNAARTSPFEPMVLSILIEQQKAISRLREELERLRMELKGP